MKHKTWVVTGASRGIGLGFVKHLLGREQKVFAVTRGESVELKALSKDKNLTIVVCDLSKEGQEKELAKTLGDSPVDVLINNAGVLLNEDGFKALKTKDLRDSMNVNLEMPIRVTQALLPLLQKSADPKVAHITSRMGSIADNGSGGYYSYRISKAALNMFNKSFSIDFPKITALVLHPGWVQTDMGGAGAQITVDQSVTGLLKVIDGAGPKASGRFFNYSGEELPW